MKTVYRSINIDLFEPGDWVSICGNKNMMGYVREAIYREGKEEYGRVKVSRRESDMVSYWHDSKDLVLAKRRLPREDPLFVRANYIGGELWEMVFTHGDHNGNFYLGQPCCDPVSEYATVLVMDKSGNLGGVFHKGFLPGLFEGDDFPLLSQFLERANKHGYRVFREVKGNL